MSETALRVERDRLSELFLSSPMGELGAGQQFRQIVRSDLSTPEVADLAAFTFLEDAAVKQ